MSANVPVKKDDLEEAKLQDDDNMREGKSVLEGNAGPNSSNGVLKISKFESARSSSNLIENYAISPRKLAEYQRHHSIQSNPFLLSLEESNGVLKSGAIHRASLSRFSKRLVSYPSPIHRKSRKPTWSLAHLSLQDLLFRQKLQHLIKNLRNHSGINDSTRLNTEKLRILNDRGAFDNQIINQNSSNRDHRRLYYKLKPSRDSFQRKIRERIEKASRSLINMTLLWGKGLFAILDDKLPIIKPLGKFIIAWDFVMLTLTCWNLISFSLIMSFKITMQESFSFSIPFLNNIAAVASFQISCLILYYIDMILKFNTSYYSDGEAVKNRKKIILNYIKSGLLFDLLGTVPFLQYTVQFDTGGSYRHFFLLFKIYPLKVFFNNINEALLNFEGKLEAVYQLIKLLFTVLVVCHVFACLWHFQALQGDLENNWLVKQGLQNNYWPSRYLRSLYFSVVTMTTVGYGDIYPNNTIEYVIAMACVLIGSGLIGYSISSIGAILEKKNRTELEFR